VGILNDVEWIDGLKVINFQSGDIVFIKMKARLSPKAIGMVKDQLDALIKRSGVAGVQFAILEDGMDVGVLRAEKP